MMKRIARVGAGTGGQVSRRRFLQVGGMGLAGAAFGGTLLGGCGGGGSSAESFPERTIQVIVAYAPGGGTAVGARILQPLVEEELGVDLEIVNRPGGGGWTGWTELANATPDGYTIGFLNSPNFMSGYLDPQYNRDEDIGSYTPIANQVTDYGAIAINPEDDRFQNIEEFMEYAQENELSATSTGVGSDDHFASLALSGEYGANFDVIHNEGSSDSVTQLLSGDVDALFANVGELRSQHDEGELKIIAVMRQDDERSEYLPDVPVLGEAGYGDVYSYSSRGIAGPADMDPEITDILIQAFRRAIESDQHREEMADQGLQIDLRTGEDYQQMLQQDEERARMLGEEYIWGDRA